MANSVTTKETAGSFSTLIFGEFLPSLQVSSGLNWIGVGRSCSIAKVLNATLTSAPQRQWVAFAWWRAFRHCGGTDAAGALAGSEGGTNTESDISPAVLLCCSCCCRPSGPLSLTGAKLWLSFSDGESSKGNWCFYVIIFVSKSSLYLRPRIKT